MKIKKFTQKDRYGNSMSFEFEVPPMQEGVPQPDSGGMPPELQQMLSQMIPGMSQGAPQGEHPGQPVGSDTVPAWLTPGEFVMNAEATREFGPQLEQMNDQGKAIQRQQGGSIPTPNVPPTPAHQQGNTAMQRLEGIKGRRAQYKNTGGHVTGQGNMRPGMATGLAAMDPMAGATGPTPANAMDVLNQGMVPGVAPPPPVYRSGGGGITQEEEERKTGLPALGEALGWGSALKRDPNVPQMDTTAPDNAVGSVAAPNQMHAPQQPKPGVMLPVDKLQQQTVPVNTSDFNNPKAEVSETEYTSSGRGNVVESGDERDKFLKAQIDQTQPEADADEEKIYSGRGDVGMRTPEERAKSAEERVKLGRQVKDKDPSAFDKIFETLKSSAMGLFDEGELGRAAVLYLGSRALGYSHGGSLNWTAKQYLQRVDGKAAAHGKRVNQLLDSGEYTKKSVDKYSKSKDINDLEEVGISYTPTGNTEFRMVPVQGENGKYSLKRMQLREVKGSDGGTYFQNINGERIDPMLTMPHVPENDPNMPEYGAKNQRVSEYLKGTMESKLKLLDGERGFGGKDQPNRPIGFTSDDAAKQFVTFARSMGLDPDSEYVQAMASSALDQAYADAAKGDKATVFTPYLTQMYIREETGTKDHLKTGEDEYGRPYYVEADLVAKLNAQMVAAATKRRQKAGLPEMSPTQIRQTMYNSAMDAWADADQEKWNRMATKGKTTGFYEFMVNNLVDFRTFK